MTQAMDTIEIPSSTSSYTFPMNNTMSSSSTTASSSPSSAVQALMMAAAAMTSAPTPSSPILASIASRGPVAYSLEGRFDASMFRGLYQRNNKRGGLKNLRCFPSCSAEHRVRGFCGRSVVVTFKPLVPSPPMEILQSLKYRAFVEFEEEPFDLSKRPREVLAKDVECKLRTKQEPTNPVIEGKYAWTKDGILVFEFNQERRGWHYSWGSNKHKCDTKHHLLCQLYEERTPGVLSLIATCSSPEFVLFCRRRRRFTLEPTGQIVTGSTGVASSSSSTTKESSASKRPRKTPNQAKVVQEIELLSSVQRIEASRRGPAHAHSKSGSISSNTTNESEDDDDDDEDDEDEDDEEEDAEEEAIAPQASKPKRIKASPAALSATRGTETVSMSNDVDVTDATHALLALTNNALLKKSPKASSPSTRDAKSSSAVALRAKG